VSFSASAFSWFMLSTRIGRADGYFCMGCTVPSTDPSTVWLADLIEAAEVLAASAEPCDPAIVKAFGHRLEMRADVVRPLFEPARMGLDA
jgi:hypothetical protein